MPSQGASCPWRQKPPPHTSHTHAPQPARSLLYDLTSEMRHRGPVPAPCPASGRRDPRALGSPHMVRLLPDVATRARAAAGFPRCTGWGSSSAHGAWDLRSSTTRPHIRAHVRTMHMDAHKHTHADTAPKCHSFPHGERGDADSAFVCPASRGAHGEAGARRWDARGRATCHEPVLSFT